MNSVWTLIKNDYNKAIERAQKLSTSDTLTEIMRNEANIWMKTLISIVRNIHPNSGNKKAADKYKDNLQFYSKILNQIETGTYNLKKENDKMSQTELRNEINKISNSLKKITRSEKRNIELCRKMRVLNDTLLSMNVTGENMDICNPPPTKNTPSRFSGR